MSVATLRYQADENLPAALDLALRGIGGPRRVDCFQASSEALRLGITYGKLPDDWQRLPAPLGADDLIPIIASWLALEAEYGDPPDTDGSAKRGFAIDNLDDHTAWEVGVVTIRPYWTVYGK